MTRAFFGLLRAAWKEYERDYARYFAVAMVYYALISLVPLVLLVLATLGLALRLSNVAQGLKVQVLEAVESGFGTPLTVSIEQMLQTLQAQSGVATAVSLGGLLLTASLLVRHLRMSFRAIWKYSPPLVAGGLIDIIRASFTEKVIAFLMVLGGSGLLLAALAIIAVMHWMTGLYGRVPVLSHTAGWLVVLPTPLVVVPLTFALLFMFLPPVRLPWRHVWLAAVLCALAWFAGTEVLALYGAFISSGFSTYGALGAVLVFMLWMNVISQVLFFGAELCKVVSARRSTSAS